MLINIKNALAILVCTLVLSVTSLQARDRILFNEGWRFKKLTESEVDTMLNYSKIKPWILPSGNRFLKSTQQYQMPDKELDGGQFSKTNFNDSQWRLLDLPHDWGIEGPFIQSLPGETAKLPWMGVAWYRKKFEVSKKDEGQKFYLEIDGAMSFSTIWCNNKFVGGWPYGYASYQVDLTPYLEYGKENTIAIRIDNPDISSRWYPGGGIYRNVWLTKTNPIHVSQWGTSITTPKITRDEAEVSLNVKITNTKNNSDVVDVQTEIYKQDINGNIEGSPIVSQSDKLSFNSAGEEVINQSFKISNPKLWDTVDPNMYVAVTTVKKNGIVLDSYNTPFGIREIAFTVEDGFHLNGQRVQLKGVCMHHDHGSLGAAFHTRAMERQIEILKEMGVNAIRTSHNPPAREMLDLCDRMGILVLDEVVDTWIQPKKENGYSTIFLDWHEQDLRAFIQRDFNHPSVIAWSTGNEVGEQHNQQGVIISKWLTNIVHEEDSTRVSTIGCDNPSAGFNGFQNSTDVFGYNYKPHLYNKFREENPNIPLYASETTSTLSTRGEYLFPVDDDKNGGKLGVFMSSYDLYSTGWGCIPDTEFKAQEEAPFSAGEFVWTGFDYLGEPTPFTADMTVLTNYHNLEERAKAEKELEKAGKIVVPSRSSYFGIVDLAGFKKDRFYIYQAHWRPDFPMAHILPHWNWENRIGQITPIHVYTSGDSAELFLNGKSLGKRTKKPLEYRLRWDDVVYEPGEVKVVAYKDGKVWAEDIVKTSGKPAQIVFEADRQEMKADGHDLIFATVELQDKDGLFAPRANNLIEFEVSGPARIVATDNGDQTSHESFQNPYINAFNGKALVILKSNKGQPGNIILKARSKGMKPQVIKLKSIR